MPVFDNQAQEALLERFNRRGKRGLRLPKPDRARNPDSIERRYARDLQPLIRAFKEVVKEIILPRLPDMLEAARRELPSTLKTDAFSDEIEAVFTQARIAFARKYTVQEAQALAEKYAKTGADYNAKEIRGQFLKVLGLQPVLREPYLGAIQDLFVAENVDLITSIPESNFDKIQNLVREAVNSGRLSRNLAADIESEYGAQISEVTNNVSARARLIARDQIAKLNSNLNMARMQSLGISKYTWRTSQDERVRQSHAELEGKEYFWNDPPSINGRRLHPGQDYQCRCTAEPVFSSSDILEGTELGKELA